MALNCKTPEEVWKSHTSKLDNLKVFVCVAYMHQREYKLDPRAKKCMFVGYPEGVKGWKLCDEREDKDEASDEGHLEEIEELSGESQDNDLDSYQLARYQHRREIRAPKRYGYSDLVAFALIATEELEDLEPMSYREAVMSKDKKLWKCAMEEKMTSLDKNKTWVLVDKPKDQLVVGCKWVFIRKEGIVVFEKLRCLKSEIGD
ncbi:hypothetical protein AXG93_702s1250 [Marchantia polymorpha subsp. ruderalis]|uniref:Retroviral polymerase SH3-like domain-containing protein n=1 Tax=Marchantia polymorpha subsp. ruderalis TaxID=1480154 RepID=A0A176WAF8_MARPO|nr:hypothetical protein AXG93_702s1250 [Marchantia polymorpha subsp. ruderalis]